LTQAATAALDRLRAALRCADKDVNKMKRCEEKIRYGTAAGATWSLWGIWLDRYLRGRRHRRERRIRVSVLRRVAPHIAVQAAAMNDALTRN
jgi:hypothetical protein